jgi:hypothetical protein
VDARTFGMSGRLIGSAAAVLDLRREIDLDPLHADCGARVASVALPDLPATQACDAVTEGKGGRVLATRGCRTHP